MALPNYLLDPKCNYNIHGNGLILNGPAAVRRTAGTSVWPQGNVSVLVHRKLYTNTFTSTQKNQDFSIADFHDVPIAVSEAAPQGGFVFYRVVLDYNADKFSGGTNNWSVGWDLQILNGRCYQNRYYRDLNPGNFPNNDSGGTSGHHEWYISLNSDINIVNLIFRGISTGANSHWDDYKLNCVVSMYLEPGWGLLDSAYPKTDPAAYPGAAWAPPASWFS